MTEKTKRTETKPVIVFDNPGRIDPLAISTFGVSVKEGENPIGFFGTGLKYALAVLLRTGHEIEIWAGDETFRFGTEATTIRGETFDLVTMNGERLGFTTQVGKTWEVWMAYRELYCNARDENGEVYRGNTPDPNPDRTRVVVRGSAFAEVHETRDRFFIEREADIESDNVGIHRMPSVAAFYRGVRVIELPKPAMFTYDERRSIELTEDRTAKNSWEVLHRMGRSWTKCSDVYAIRQAVTAEKDFIESDLDFDWLGELSPEFLRAVAESVADLGIAKVNASAVKAWRRNVKEEFLPRELALTVVQRETLRRASVFAESIGFRISDYSVVAVENLGGDTLGFADRKTRTIYVAERAFQIGGTKQVAATLIEEFVHLRHGYDDMTRTMQNFLFEKIVSLGEEAGGVPL